MRIAGQIDYNSDLTDKTSVIEEMANACYGGHSGIYMQKEAALAHTKREGGKCQPVTMAYKNDIYTIVFAGRLYNGDKLCSELNCLGYNINGHDALTALASYIEWGEECVIKFEGYFAFAVWTEKEKKLYIARDRAGIAPLYYYKYDNGLIFSSEIKSLLKNPLIPRVIDQTGLKQIFLLGPAKIYGSGVVKGVSEIKPGYYLTLQKNSFSLIQYYKLTAKEHKENAADTAEHIRFLIESAVKNMLDGSVNPACMLSGGIDSSILSYTVAKFYGEKSATLDTYSVDYQDNQKFFEKNMFQPDSDNEYIKVMKEYINSNHTSVILDNLEVAQTVYKAAEGRSLAGMADIDSSLLLFLEQIGKKHKACFSGECADELLGGYPWYHDKKMLNLQTFPWSNSLELRQNILNSGVISGAEDFVLEQYENTINQAHCLPGEDAHNCRIRQMFVLNYYWFMQTLIDRTERMGALTGVEAILPFCDSRFIDYAYNIPWEIKAYKGREKGILREAYKDILPEKIVWRKKSPYPKSWNPIIMDFYNTKITEILNGKTLLSEIINKDYLDKLCSGEMPAPWFGQLMRLPQVLGYLIQVNEFFTNFKIQLV